MNLQNQYQEISALKTRIDDRLSRGTDYHSIRELAYLLAHDKKYQELYRMDNQLIRLQHFLTVWREEQDKMPGRAATENIFYQIDSLDCLEQKYRRIEYYGLRVENHVPEPCLGELLDWLLEHRVSGIALGIIIANRTEQGCENILCIARELKRRAQLPDAVLLLSYAREKFPDKDIFLLEETDCWLQAGQKEKALELLREIRRPTAAIRELMAELEQVIHNAG